MIIQKTSEQQITKTSKHWLSLKAPQQPRNPSNSIAAPPTINTMAADSNNPVILKSEFSAPTFVSTAILFLSTYAHIPSPKAAAPKTWN